jgi:hypothetical protein
VRSRAYPEIWTAVYRLFDASGRLLYVGIGYNYLARWRMHAKKPWWPEVASKDVVWYKSRLVAAYEEARAIRTENPIYNVRPGIDPIGFVVFERKNRFGAWECPAQPEMVVAEYDQLDVIRQVEAGRAHAAVVYEGVMRDIFVPWDWYRRARAALGEPTDL